STTKITSPRTISVALIRRSISTLLANEGMLKGITTRVSRATRKIEWPKSHQFWLSGCVSVWSSFGSSAFGEVGLEEMRGTLMSQTGRAQWLFVQIRVAVRIGQARLPNVCLI